MTNKKEVIIQGYHMDLTDTLKKTVMEKVDRLFKHGEQIVRIRVELCFHKKKRAKEEFTAKGHIEIQGKDLHASETSEDLYKSLDKMIDKLNRMITQRSRQTVVKRNHPHKVEIPAELPKV